MIENKHRIRGIMGSIAVSLLLSLVVCALQPALAAWEYPLLDWHLNSTTAAGTQEKIVLILGSDRSMEEMGVWPWPRSVHARLIDEKLGRAKAIGYDVYLVDKTSIEQDAALARAIGEHGNVALGGNYRANGELQPPLALFAEKALLGYFNFFPDGDYVMRRYALAQRREASGYSMLTPSFVFAALEAAGYAPVIDGANRLRLSGMERPVQLDEELNAFKLPVAQNAYPVYEFTDVLNGRIPADAFDDALVYVGISATGASDNVHTSMGYLSGTRVMADMTYSLLSGDMPKEAPFFGQWAFALAVLSGTLLGAFLLPGKLHWLPVAAAAGAPIFAHLMFRFAGLYLPSAALCAVAIFSGVVYLFYLRMLRETQQRQEMLMNMIACMVSAIDAKDPVTAGHSRRVSDVSARIAELKGLRRREVESIRFAALIHDIGKIGVPDAVLNKPGKFTPEEFDAMKEHPGKGIVIMEQANLPESMISGIRDHHERLDGKGYPAGKRAEELSLCAQIIKIADVYDALSSKRQYKDAWPPERVCDVLYEGRGTEFNTELLDLFIEEIRPAHWKPEQPVSGPVVGE